MTFHHKLECALISGCISLFFSSFNAYSYDIPEQVSACTLANNKADFATATKISTEILKNEPSNYDGLLCKGRALGAQGNYADALSALDMAATNARTGFDEIIAYILMGNLQKENKKNVEAIASYEKSLKICAIEKNQKFTRINYNLMAEAYAQNNDLNAALASYLKGDKLANNDNERADGDERLAATYSALGQFDSAIEYQVKGILMQKKSGTLDQYANANLTLGQIYVQAKDYPNAEKTYEKLVQFSKENGGAYYEAKATMSLAEAKAAAGDKTSAKTILADAQKMAKTIGDNELSAEIDASIKKINQ